jgi:two-component system, NarL family, response regulator DegU
LKGVSILDNNNLENEQIKILLVDDHTLVREGFARMLELEEDFLVVGQAECAEEALAKAQELKPDIILMDIRLKGTNGIETTRMIKEKLTETEVIILSMYDEEEYVRESVKAGATGYVLKDISQEELIRNIKVVHSGGSYIQPSLARKVLQDLAATSIVKTTAPVRSMIKDLSEREIEVLQHVADGKSNKEVAVELTISEKTVKAHLRSIFRKLEVGDRAQAVATAMRRGLVE